MYQGIRACDGPSVSIPNKLDALLFCTKPPPPNVACDRSMPSLRRRRTRRGCVGGLRSRGDLMPSKRILLAIVSPLTKIHVLAQSPRNFRNSTSCHARITLARARDSFTEWSVPECREVRFARLHQIGFQESPMLSDLPCRDDPLSGVLASGRGRHG
jgi:hypothetical protein